MAAKIGKKKPRVSVGRGTPEKYVHPYVVVIMDTVTGRPSEEVECMNLSKAKVIGEMVAKRMRVTRGIEIRKVKNFIHKQPIRWVMGEGREWRPTVNYNGFEAGDRVPRVGADSPCLFNMGE